MVSLSIDQINLSTFIQWPLSIDGVFGAVVVVAAPMKVEVVQPVDVGPKRSPRDRQAGDVVRSKLCWKVILQRQ